MNPTKKKPDDGPWEWTINSGRWLLWAAHGHRWVILEADAKSLYTKCDSCGRADDVPIMRTCDDTGRLVELTPEHPIAKKMAALPDLIEACKALLKHHGESVESIAAIEAACAALTKAGEAGYGYG